MELDGSEFERKIYVKKDAAPLLAWDVAHNIRIHRSIGRGAPDHIAIGTATDPYQPAEREYGVTRLVWRTGEEEGLSVSIITSQTRSCGILTCCSGLRSGRTWDRHYDYHVAPRLNQLLEPRAPRPDLRLAG